VSPKGGDPRARRRKNWDKERQAEARQHDDTARLLRPGLAKIALVHRWSRIIEDIGRPNGYRILRGREAKHVLRRDRLGFGSHAGLQLMLERSGGLISRLEEIIDVDRFEII